MVETKEQAQQTVTMSINELIFIQLRDLKGGQRDLNRRMDRIETRMDKLETKLEDTRKELNERIDKLSNKMDSSTNQGQIATISTIGIGVAAVNSTVVMLYSLFSK